MCKKIQMLVLILILVSGNFNSNVSAQELTKGVSDLPDSKKADVVDTSFDRRESPKAVDIINRKMNDTIHCLGKGLYLGDKTLMRSRVRNMFVIESQNLGYTPIPESERSRWKRTGLFILVIAVAGAAVGAAMAATQGNKSSYNFIQPTLPRGPISKF